ncbi:MAG: L-serine ammonia-lyase, iron-sulfur-dependent, subunit alpha [Erysipelotrichaceae bacterium]|nr:L-serine ammonia-lyase, iron-sulfur-dependent, subunit alpha [Erysipelotrichaceae bacterium]
MNSIKDIYRIGHGPSSSHTIAPSRACAFFKAQHPDVDYVKIRLEGSLALTARGHYTDRIVIETMAPIKTDIDFKLQEGESYIIIKGYKNGELIDTWNCLSLGGGSIRIDKYNSNDEVDYYQENWFDEINKYIHENNIDVLTYIYNREPDLKAYLSKSFDVIIDEVERGLSDEGVLCKELKLNCVAKNIFNESIINNDDELKLMAYSYAANEENAKGHIVVTAPTLGACGVVAAILYYFHHDLKVAKDKLLDAMAVGGLFGNIIKKNASISGAIGGCQAEVGTATAMASAMVTWLNGESLNTCSYAAEIGIEHFLGLTCDPVKGYVIIPCIERNAVAASRAFNAAKIAKTIHKFRNNTVSFDAVVKTMKYTGSKLPYELKETSLGGLAKEVVIDE